MNNLLPTTQEISDAMLELNTRQIARIKRQIIAVKIFMALNFILAAWAAVYGDHRALSSAIFLVAVGFNWLAIIKMRETLALLMLKREIISNHELP